MYAVVNMGHSHPKIVDAAVQQLKKAAVVNLPWHSPLYGQLGRKLHEVCSPLGEEGSC
jgi:ornithine--oxo-acid transaminase